MNLDQSNPNSRESLDARSVSPEPTLWTACYRGFRTNLLPGIVIQFLMGTLVLSYYFLPVFSHQLNRFTLWVDQSLARGLSYDMLMAITLSAIIPITISALQKNLGPVAWWKQLLFLTGFVVFVTVELHFLYLLLNAIASSLTESTIMHAIIEACLDQFVIGPLFSVWLMALSFRLMDLNFNISLWWRSLNRRFCTHTVPVILISNWVIWLPASFLLYLMPVELQVTMDNLANCFFTLVLLVLSKNASTASQEALSN